MLTDRTPSRASSLPQGLVLSAFDQAYRKHIAGRTVQNVVGGGAQQQRQAMPAMAADHDQVAGLFLGQVVNLLARLAVSQVAVLLGEFRILQDQPVKAFLGL